MFCCYRDRAVREYPFAEEAGVFGKPDGMSVSLMKGKDCGGINVLVINVWGALMGGDEGASMTPYYFAENGELVLFHKALTVYGYPDNRYFWDGAEFDGFDDLLVRSMLDAPITQTFFGVGYADQSATPDTPAITAETILRAYGSERQGGSSTEAITIRAQQ